MASAITHFNSIRGFEKYVQGKPAEEVTRICGIGPWHHHLSSTKAVDVCFGADVGSAGHMLRECMQNMAHINDKILPFYFLAAPDFVMDPDANYKVRNVIGIAQAAPDLAKQVIKMRRWTDDNDGKIRRKSYSSNRSRPRRIFKAHVGQPVHRVN